MIDFKKLRPAPKMVDPIRFPKVQFPLEREFKDSLKISMDKILIDLTKRMVEMKNNG